MLRNDKENPHVLQVIRGVWRVLLSQQAFTFVNRGSLASKNKKAQHGWALAEAFGLQRILLNILNLLIE